MSLAELEQAKRNAMVARRRLDSRLIAVQQRLQPANLAGEAWDGVKEKSADLAEGALTAVRKRPATVSMALGAFVLFLARKPLTRTVSRLVSNDADEDPEDGRIVTRIETREPMFTASAPTLADAKATEGVK